MSDLAKLFVDIANKYVGVEESPTGSNRGPLIDRWNTNVRAPIGSFWCASFVSGVAMEWEDQSGLDWPLCFSADCDVWLSSARKHGVLKTQGSPGDILLLVTGDDAYHIGIVTGRNEDGALMSVEGNSNNDGSRNGYMVARRSNLYRGRNKSNVFFIKPWSLVAPDVDWKICNASNNKFVDALVENGRTFAPLRKSLELFIDKNEVDASLAWGTEGPTLDGKPLPVQYIQRNNVTYVSIRSLAKVLGKALTVNTENKKVFLS